MSRVSQPDIPERSLLFCTDTLRISKYHQSRKCREENRYESLNFAQVLQYKIHPQRDINAQMLSSADALSWLRKYKHKWMDTYKEKIEVSLESVLEQTLKPQRTTEEDRVC